MNLDDWFAKMIMLGKLQSFNSTKFGDTKSMHEI